MIEFQLDKRYSDNFRLSVTGRIKTGELIGLHGPSGGGKSSLLRLLAGLDAPDAGELSVDGVRWVTKQGNERIDALPPQERSVGLVFQDYALFPHLSVEENLRFALRPGQDDAIVAELLTLTELTDQRRQRPATLSGGQRQRVALARALVQQPRLLLLDEPFAALNPVLRRRLGQLLADVHRRYGLTTVLVSHDRGEMSRFATSVWRMENGSIIKSGRPSAVFRVNDRLSATIVEVREKTVVVEIGGQLVERARGEGDVVGMTVEW